MDKQKIDDALFHQNAFVLNVLPSMLKGLIRTGNRVPESHLPNLQPNLQSILQSRVQSESKQKNDNDPQPEPDFQLCQLVVDENKSIILSLLLGPMFIRSLELFDKINFVVVDPKNSIDDEPEVFKYLDPDYRDSPLMFARFSDSHPELQHEKRHSARTLEPTHICDLNSWYCNCDEYLSNFKNGRTCFFKDMHYPQVDPEELLIKILHKSQTKLLDPIPLCPHILALLILAYNNIPNHYSWSKVAKLLSIL